MKQLFSAAVAAFLLASAVPAFAADPFEDARYDIGIKKNAEALAIVDSGAFDINMQTDEGYSLLHYAADAGNLEMVKALLARGADPTLKSARGSTAYDMATAAMVKAELRKAMGAAAPALKSAGGAAATPASPAANSTPAKAAAPAADAGRKKECQQKWYADQALASDSTAKMSAYRKWQQCLKTGRYW